jgi:hypothetical protein
LKKFKRTKTNISNKLKAVEALFCQYLNIYKKSAQLYLEFSRLVNEFSICVSVLFVCVTKEILKEMDIIGVIKTLWQVEVPFQFLSTS